MRIFYSENIFLLFIFLIKITGEQNTKPETENNKLLHMITDITNFKNFDTNNFTENTIKFNLKLIISFMKPYELAYKLNDNDIRIYKLLHNLIESLEKISINLPLKTEDILNFGVDFECFKNFTNDLDNSCRNKQMLMKLFVDINDLVVYDAIDMEEEFVRIKATIVKHKNAILNSFQMQDDINGVFNNLFLKINLITNDFKNYFENNARNAFLNVFDKIKNQLYNLEELINQIDITLSSHSKCILKRIFDIKTNLIGKKYLLTNQIKKMKNLNLDELIEIPNELLERIFSIENNLFQIVKTIEKKDSQFLTKMIEISNEKLEVFSDEFTTLKNSFMIYLGEEVMINSQVKRLSNSITQHRDMISEFIYQLSMGDLYLNEVNILRDKLKQIIQQINNFELILDDYFIKIQKITSISLFYLCKIKMKNNYENIIEYKNSFEYYNIKLILLLYKIDKIIYESIICENINQKNILLEHYNSFIDSLTLFLNLLPGSQDSYEDVRIKYIILLKHILDFDENSKTFARDNFFIINDQNYIFCGKLTKKDIVKEQTNFILENNKKILNFLEEKNANSDNFMKIIKEIDDICGKFVVDISVIRDTSEISISKIIKIRDAIKKSYKMLNELEGESNFYETNLLKLNEINEQHNKLEDDFANNKNLNSISAHFSLRDKISDLFEESKSIFCKIYNYDKTFENQISTEYFTKLTDDISRNIKITDDVLNNCLILITYIRTDTMDILEFNLLVKTIKDESKHNQNHKKYLNSINDFIYIDELRNLTKETEKNIEISSIMLESIKKVIRNNRLTKNIKTEINDLIYEINEIHEKIENLLQKNHNNEIFKEQMFETKFENVKISYEKLKQIRNKRIFSSDKADLNSLKYSLSCSYNRSKNLLNDIKKEISIINVETHEYDRELESDTSETKNENIKDVEDKDDEDEEDEEEDEGIESEIDNNMISNDDSEEQTSEIIELSGSGEFNKNKNVIKGNKIDKNEISENIKSSNSDNKFHNKVSKNTIRGQNSEFIKIIFYVTLFLASALSIGLFVYFYYFK